MSNNLNLQSDLNDHSGSDLNLGDSCSVINGHDNQHLEHLEHVHHHQNHSHHPAGADGHPLNKSSHIRTKTSDQIDGDTETTSDSNNHLNHVNISNANNIEIPDMIMPPLGVTMMPPLGNSISKLHDPLMMERCNSNED